MYFSTFPELNAAPNVTQKLADHSAKIQHLTSRNSFSANC